MTETQALKNATEKTSRLEAGIEIGRRLKVVYDAIYPDRQVDTYWNGRSFTIEIDGQAATGISNAGAIKRTDNPFLAGLILEHSSRYCFDFPLFSQWFINRPWLLDWLNPNDFDNLISQARAETDAAEAAKEGV